MLPQFLCFSPPRQGGITVKKGNDIVPIAGLHETRQPRSSAHGRTKVILRPCAGSAGETGRSVSYMCASSCLLVPIPASYRSVAGHHCPCSRKCLGTGSHLRHHHSPEDGAAAETRRCSTHRLASRRRCLEMKSSPWIQAFLFTLPVLPNRVQLYSGYGQPKRWAYSAVKVMNDT